MLVVANRLELARWLGSALWLLLPVGFARVFPSLDTASWYAASYFVCMVGMVVARAVAHHALHLAPLAEVDDRRGPGDAQPGRRLRGGGDVELDDLQPALEVT